MKKAPTNLCTCFAMLIGTVSIASEPFVPPRQYEIDVTPLVRGWARGEPKYGLALRIIPNRSIDDGWTVRFTPDEQKPMELRIATYR